MRGRFSALVVGLVALIGCEELPSEPDTQDDEVAVQVLFFEKLFTVEEWTGAAAYCLSQGSWDPMQDVSAGVLNAFEDHQPKVVPGSKCTIEIHGTYLTETGEQARSFHIDRWEIDGNTAELEGFWRHSGLGAGGWICNLEKKSGAWRIRSCQETWIA